jgi:hypothetical protein
MYRYYFIPQLVDCQLARPNPGSRGPVKGLLLPGLGAKPFDKVEILRILESVQNPVGFELIPGKAV